MLDERRLVPLHLREKILIFIFSFTFLEFVNYLCFETLKGFIITPINSSSNELRSNEELILIKYDFKDNNRFYNIHYLMNLNYVYKKISNSSDSSTNKINFIISKDSIFELKFKLNKILDEFNSNLIKVSAVNKIQQPVWVRIFNINLEFAEMFSKLTSPSILNYTSQLLLIMSLIFINKIESSRLYETHESPNKQTSYKQNFNYFYENLINFENSFNRLYDNNKFMNYAKGSRYLIEEMDQLRDLLKKRLELIRKKSLSFY